MLLKKIGATLVAAVLCCSLLPAAALAADGSGSALTAGSASGLHTSNAAKDSAPKTNNQAKAQTVQSKGLKAVLSANQRTMTITLTGKKYVKASHVYFPIWTAKKGQDDIRWHKAKRKGSTWTASIPVKKHSDSGIVHVHCYATTGGVQKYVSAVKLKVSAPKVKDFSVTKTGNGSYVATLSGIRCPSGVKEIKVPTWTKRKGQDDIVWHKAKRQKDGSWKVTIAASAHKGETGLYISNAYITGKNGIEALAGKLSQKITAKDYMFIKGKAGSGSRTFWVVNPSKKPVKLKVWVGAKRTNVKTYKTTGAGSGRWKATIDCLAFKKSGTASVEVLEGKKVVKTLTFKVTKNDLSKSVDPELDRIIRQIIANKIGRGGNALRRAFDYVVSYPYIGGSKYPTGNWSVPFAKEMYKNHGGNCYRFAALFCWLAKELGYDAKVVAGYVPSISSGWAPHGWVEIRSGGTTYVCDPDLAKELPGYHWFWTTYGSAPCTYLR